MHLVQWLNNKSAVGASIFRVVPEIEHCHVGSPGGVALGFMGEEFLDGFVDLGAVTPTEENAALARRRAKLSVGDELGLGPAVPGEDAGVPGEHEVLEVAGDRLLHVEGSARFLEAVLQNIQTHGGNPHHVRRAMLDPFHPKYSHFPASSMTIGNMFSVKPFQFLPIKVVYLGPEPVHEGDDLGGFHACRVIVPHRWGRLAGRSAPQRSIRRLLQDHIERNRNRRRQRN